MVDFEHLLEQRRPSAPSALVGGHSAPSKLQSPVNGRTSPRRAAITGSRFASPPFRTTTAATFLTARRAAVCGWGVAGGAGVFPVSAFPAPPFAVAAVRCPCTLAAHCMQLPSLRRPQQRLGGPDFFRIPLGPIGAVIIFSQLFSSRRHLYSHSRCSPTSLSSLAARHV